MKHYVWQLSHVSFLLLSFSNNWEYDPLLPRPPPPPLCIQWIGTVANICLCNWWLLFPFCFFHFRSVLFFFCLVLGFFVFLLFSMEIRRLLFWKYFSLTVYCVHTFRDFVFVFSDIRRSWLRIVTDIIFCIHGISLLNKIKDQNLEFEKKKSATVYLLSIRERTLSTLPFFSTVTHISFILQRHSHENLAGITLLTFQGAATSEMWRGGGRESEEEEEEEKKNN